jgi:hypothetical protein
MKPQKLWIVVGPANGAAPYYGIAFTKKELKKQHGKLPPGARFARVIVEEE